MAIAIRNVRTAPAHTMVWKPTLRASTTPSAVMSAACLGATTSSPVGNMEKPNFDMEVSDGDSTHDGYTSSTESESHRARGSECGSPCGSSCGSPCGSSRTVLTRDALLQMRHSVKVEVPPSGRLTVASSPATPKTKVAAPKPSSPVARAALQHDVRETRLRAVKSMLNKLTLEKFEELCPKFLALCESGEDLDVIATQIFDKAAQQHNFSAMYADLCERLFVHLGGEAGLGRELQWALLRLCRGFFLGNSLQPLSDDAEEEAKVFHKKRALGNLRFLGQLLCRGLLASTEIFLCADELMKLPLAPLKLEGLAVFLTVVGPAFDRAAWPHREKLLAIFDGVRHLTSASDVHSRVQVLLRNLLDLKTAGWRDKRIAEGPKKLDEVAAEARRKTAPIAARPELPCEPKIVEQSKPTEFRMEAAEFVPSFLVQPDTQPSKPKAKRLLNKKVPAPSSAAM